MLTCLPWLAVCWVNVWCSLGFISFQFIFRSLSSVFVEQAETLWEIFLTWWCFIPLSCAATNWCETNSGFKEKFQQFYLPHFSLSHIFVLCGGSFCFEAQNKKKKKRSVLSSVLMILQICVLSECFILWQFGSPASFFTIVVFIVHFDQAATYIYRVDWWNSFANNSWLIYPKFSALHKMVVLWA